MRNPLGGAKKELMQMKGTRGKVGVLGRGSWGMTDKMITKVPWLSISTDSTSVAANKKTEMTVLPSMASRHIRSYINLL